MHFLTKHGCAKTSILSKHVIFIQLFQMPNMLAPRTATVSSVSSASSSCGISSTTFLCVPGRPQLSAKVKTICLGHSKLNSTLWSSFWLEISPKRIVVRHKFSVKIEKFQKLTLDDTVASTIISTLRKTVGQVLSPVHFLILKISDVS